MQNMQSGGLWNQRRNNGPVGSPRRNREVPNPGWDQWRTNNSPGWNKGVHCTVQNQKSIWGAKAVSWGGEKVGELALGWTFQWELALRWMRLPTDGQNTGSFGERSPCTEYKEHQNSLEVYAFIDIQVDEMRIGDGAPCWAGGCLLLAEYLASCICRAVTYCILAN